MLFLSLFLFLTLASSTNEAQYFYYIYSKDAGVITIAREQVDSVKVENATVNFYQANVVIYSKMVSQIDSITFTPPVDPNEDDSNLDPASSKKEIKSFRINKSLNNIDLDIVGKISGNVITLTTKRWIGNVSALIPTFEAEGNVRVEGIKQTSGENAHDFRQVVVYMVRAGDLTERRYTVVLKSPQATGLPVMKINTDKNAAIESKQTYVPGTLWVSSAKNPTHDMSDTRLGIRRRGNATYGMPKRSYRIKLDEKAKMLGHSSAKSWVLLANYQDPTMMMNSIAFELARRLGLKFSNSVNYVELYLNNSYQGCYQFTEQIQVHNDRVDVDEKTGYLVELDSYYDEPYKFHSPLIQLPVNVKSPDLTSSAGMDFIKKSINEMEAALFDKSKGFPDNNYQELLDINSVIAFLLVNEITRNTELQHPKSMYVYKDTNSKIFMGPVWDFDWGFGYEGQGYYSQQKSLLLGPKYAGSQTGYKFFRRFFDDPKFRTQYKTFWNANYDTKIKNIDAYVDELAEILKKSQVENYEMWNPNINYNSHVTKIKQWLKERVVYMNTEINKY